MLKLFVWKGIDDPECNLGGVAVVASSEQEAREKALANLEDYTDNEMSLEAARLHLESHYPDTYELPAAVWF